MMATRYQWTINGHVYRFKHAARRQTDDGETAMLWQVESIDGQRLPAIIDMDVSIQGTSGQAPERLD